MPSPRPAKPVQAAPLSLPAGQCLTDNLPARTLIVVLEGALRLAVRPHALSGLDCTTAVISIHLHEGECHVLADHATVSLTPAQGIAARLAVQLPRPALLAALSATRHVMTEWHQRLSAAARRAVSASRPARQPAQRACPRPTGQNERDQPSRDQTGRKPSTVR